MKSTFYVTIMFLISLPIQARDCLVSVLNENAGRVEINGAESAVMVKISGQLLSFRNLTVAMDAYGVTTFAATGIENSEIRISDFSSYSGDYPLYPSVAVRISSLKNTFEGKTLKLEKCQLF